MKRILGFWVAVALVGCGEEREPRNYVQPNVVLKDDLAGEFWFRSTITEVPPNIRGLAFVGAQNNVERVWFDIQENHVYARRTYEIAVGTADPELAPNPLEGRAGFPGAPVAAWSIEHFDIIRDYNASTGEESNSIVESTERPWYERKYIRVDWSQNHAENAFDVTAYGAEGISVSPVSYWESDPRKDDALHFERRTRMGANHEPVDADGNGVEDEELGYFDVTNHYVFDPVEGDPFNIGISYPMCFWYFQLEGGDCASQQVSVRHAFWKLPGDHEYEPREWTQKDQSMFGFFTTDRKAFNRQYWVTQSGIKYFANRFNLFKRWFGTADADTGERQLLSLEDRVDNYLRQIPYYLSPEQPDSLYDASARTLGTPNSQGEVDQGGWDFALRRIVAGMQAVSETGGDPVDEEAIETRAAAVPQILYLCNNPVRATDPEPCKTELGRETKCTDENIAICDQLRTGGDSDASNDSTRTAYWSPDCECKVRNGDVRYSVLWWVNEYNPSGPGGFGPASADPLTGETLSATAYLYGAAIDRNAAWVRDIVQILNGEIELEDVINGDYVRRFVEAERTGRTNAQRRYTPNDLKAMATSFQRGFGKGITPNMRLDPMRTGQFRQQWRQRLEAIHDSGALGEGWDTGPARLNRLRGTAIEDALMSQPEFLALAGLDPDATAVTSLTPAERLRVSPLTRTQFLKYQEQLRQKMEAHSVDFFAFDDRAYLRKAIEYAERDLDPEEIRAEALGEIYVSYAIHEVGHNMGLRHNFEGTHDPLNYFSEYWSLRNNGTIGPRTTDPLTNEEIEGGIYEYQYSSVMDYASRYYGDIHGLGRYDQAAVAYGWGGLVEAFDTQTTFNCGYLGLMQSFAEFGAPSEFYYSPRIGRLAARHYTQYPLVLGGGSFTQLNLDTSVVEGNVDTSVIQRRKIGLWNDAKMAEEVGVPIDRTARRGCYEYEPENFSCVPGTPGLTWEELDNRNASTDDDCVELPVCSDERVASLPCCDSAAENCCTYDAGLDANELESCDGLELDTFGDPTQSTTGVVARVPYRFCSDEFAGGSVTCARFDQGADVFETTEDTISTYKNYYVFNNFQRDRYGWPNNGGYTYDAAIYSRYFDPLSTVLQYYVLYRTIFEDIVEGGGNAWFDGIDEFFAKDWGFLTAAATHTFGTFGDVITTPEPGTYTNQPGYNQMHDGTPIWAQCNDDPTGYCFDPAELEDDRKPVIDILDGRYLSSEWDFSSDVCRYEWFLCQKRIGHMIDKKLAIEVLGEAGAGFLGRDTAVDSRRFTINYYKAFKPQLTQIFGAILSDDIAAYAPRFVGLDGGPVAKTDDVTVERVDWTGVDPTPEGDLIDPRTGFQVQLFASVFGMALFPSTFDQSFINYGRVFVEGGGSDFINVCRDDSDALDPERCVWFDEPESGKRFMAMRFAPLTLQTTDPKTGDPVTKEFDVDVGARMVQRLEQLYDYWQETVDEDEPAGDAERKRLYERYIDNMDFMRNLSDIFNDTLF